MSRLARQMWLSPAQQSNTSESLWGLVGLGAPNATDWMRSGLCAETDPDAFFPDRGKPTRSAKSVCMGCPVRSTCLEYAVVHNERFGVWGGLSERERRELRRQRLDSDATRIDSESDHYVEAVA